MRGLRPRTPGNGSARQMRKIVLAICVLAAVVLTLAWMIWENSAPVVTDIRVVDEEIPDEFVGFRIALVSDLHNVEFWPEIIGLLEDEKPDIIAMTGDIVDARRIDMDRAVEFAHQAAQIAPCYYVTGNHDGWLVEYEKLEAGLSEAGVRVLHNEALEIVRGSGSITLAGIDDAVFVNEGKIEGDYAEIAAPLLEQALSGAEGFAVLLAHRPELFETYARHGAALTLSGHVHGGQARLPLIGGLYGPDQGLFPKYDAGLYEEYGAALAVSRGIGNSSIPLRFNNRPEVVMIELSK